MMPDSLKADYDVFAERLLSRLNVRVAHLPKDTRLVDDLGFDSIATFELLMILEEAAGRDVPDELLENVHTVGEAFEWYRQLKSQH